MRLFIITLAFILASSAYAQTSIEKVSRNLAKHKYNKIYRCFDANMKSKVPKEQLQSLWEQIELGAGNLVSVEEVKSEQMDESVRQTATLKFDLAALRIVMSENQKGEINGLFISQLGYAPPKYGQDLRLGKKFINFMSDGFMLSGELMVPADCNNCPLVILVHGSGPNDKDETIGANKVFNDIALGLAANGIASYRYDKRFKLYPELMKKQFDLYDETINDAIAAYNLLKADTSLHLGNYYMLGHSLGAYAMPLIADSIADLKGAVLFSANARKLEDLIEYQMHYLTAWDGEVTKEEQKIIDENIVKAENIRTGNFTDTTSAEALLAYWPGLWWKGVANYNPVEQVQQNTKTPFLILQGEKDYQITMVDYNLWIEGVGNQPNVEMKSYPGLTHLFTPTEAEHPGPNDYFLPNNVNKDVIWDIADWIKKME